MNTAKSKPICIQTKKFEDNTDIHIGTCRSYDEKKPIPSFIRQLGVTVNKTPCQKNTQEKTPPRTLNQILKLPKTNDVETKEHSRQQTYQKTTY